ncbi:MAG: LEA type 2 family protein, partial [Gemmatimonadales bacterium]
LYAVFSALALVLGGCASVGPENFLQPKVELSQVTLTSVGFKGGTLELLLTINNPNRFNVLGSRLEAGLDVEGAHFGDALLQDAFTLPKDGATTLIVPLTFDWAGVSAAARAALDYGRVGYHIAGVASVNTPAGRSLSVPFTGDGTVPMIHRVQF